MEFHTDTLRIPKGNDFMTLHKVIAFDVVKKQPVEDFDLLQATDIVVNTVRNSITKSPVTNYDILPDNILKIKWNGTKLSSGYYSVEISGVWHGVNWRIYNIKENTFWIVEANELASYPHSMFVAEGTFAFNAKIGLLFGAQADWKQENPTEADYIRNKPYVPQSLSDLKDDASHRTVTDSEKAAWNAKSNFSGSYNDLTDKPTIPDELSDLNDDSTHRLVTDAEKSAWNGKYSKPNDGIPSTDLASGVIPDVSNFITKSVNDLVNYYTKSQTYTQAEVQQLINAVKQFTYESVSTLPTASSSTMNKIYLVPSSDPQTQNVKDEYITLESSGTYSWELIGNTSVDLSGYVTTTALNTALADYVTSTSLSSILAGYQTKIDSNHKLDYSLLSNTPTIPDAQIQSDWEQTVTTAKDYIKNKPTIPAAQVNSDWNASSGVAQILNKPTIPTITFRQW